MVAPEDLQRCEERLKQSDLAVGAAGLSSKNVSTTALPWHLLSSSLQSLVEQPDVRDVEARACAVLLQAFECGEMVPDWLVLKRRRDLTRNREVPPASAPGSLVMPIILAIPEPAAARGRDARRQTPLSVPSSSILLRKDPLKQPLEPAAVTMLLYVQKQGIPEAVKAARSKTDGVHAILESRWPRLYKHLKNICSRIDIADVTHRQNGATPPLTTLQRVVEDEWLAHGFVGSLPKKVLLWAWDQFTMQGWQFASELAACCFWLIRREVRGLDAAKAGATELVGAMRFQLHTDAKLEQLQALLAESGERNLEKNGMPRRGLPPPLVMLPIPYKMVVHDQIDDPDLDPAAALPLAAHVAAS